MKNWKFLLGAMSILSFCSLVAAYCYPFMYSEFVLDMPFWLPNFLAGKMQDWIICKGKIPIGPQYLFGIVRDLFFGREFFVGMAIATFSIVFPLIKSLLASFLSIFGGTLELRVRERLLSILNHIGKWSMVDVFIVGMLIVFMKAEGFHFQFKIGAGLYFYAFSAMASSFVLQKLKMEFRTE